MKHLIGLKVNGETYEIAIEPRKTLLDVIRNDIGLTGTKKGSDMGECGACTVLLDGKAVCSCLVLGVEAEGKEVITIEGLAKGTTLDPLQDAFVKYGAIQCGFCTPGMIITARNLLDENPTPTEEEVREAICGNLCRCTGYVKIVEAVLDAAGSEKGG
jgi:carbon-monoxide dehydrogenase small subunit